MSSSSTSKHANDAKRKRANQSTQRGMGSLYESPKKSRATHGNISAPKTFVHDLKQEALKKQLASLRAEIQAEEDAGSESEDDDFSMDIDTDLNSGGLNDQIQQSDPPSQPAAFTTPPASPAPGRTPDLSYVPEPAPLQEENANNAQPGKRRRQAPNESAKSLYHRWEDLLPEIYAPYLKYMEQSYGQMALPLLPSTVRVCEPTCQETHKTSRILCLYPHHYQYIDFQWCTTSSLPVCLVRKGLFPTAPTRPGIAISLELLAFYKALFEHACDATTALAHALNAHYTRRGFVLVDKKGCLVGEPFRKGLGKAFQWYDCLLHKIELDVEAAVQSATKHWKEPGAADPSEADNDGADTSGADPSGADTSGADTSGADTSGAEADSSGTENSEAESSKEGRKNDKPKDRGPYPALTLKECAAILQSRCPACFAGVKFGSPFKQGADIVVAVDGCFNHRHVAAQGDGPAFYHPLYFLSKAFVDMVGREIEAARKCPEKARKKDSKLAPDHAVDACENSHEAGSGSNVKTSLDRFDDGGIMGLVCRHDIPLFLANIDTPGEQQKYAVSLIRHLFSLIPNIATVTVLYDVGCVLDRSRHRFNIFTPSISRRLSFSTSAMHAFAHEMACQIINNPRFREGLGLSDGEGTERLWSRLTGLIGILRMVLRNKRIFLLDRHLKSLGFEMRANLGNLLTDKMQKNIPKHRLTAETMLERCAMSVPDLRREWEVQKQSQTSVRAHPENQIKKELDSILKLQTNLDAVEKSISETRNFVENKHGGSHSSEDILDDLGKQQNDLMDKVEQLYASLNVDESFPELIGIDLDFVRKLLLLRTLKINIRKRAIASFFEWDKVNQAKGGKGPTIGTKLHQYARRAIAKRTPTLLKAIRKFNKICGECAEIYRPEYNIPLPEVLPVDLHDLQHNSSILEDIWMSPASPDGNAWLYDSDVREAMRAVQQADRCQEEVKRLGIEFDNLCRWFGKELTSVELALVVPENAILAGPLSQYREKLLSYIPHWQTAQTQARYQYHRKSASDAAKALSSKLNGQVVPVSYKWAEVVVLDLSGPQGNPFEDPSERGMDEEEEEPFIEAVANPVAISTPALAVTTLKSIRYDASLLDRLNLVPRNTDLGTQETTHRWFDFTLPGGTKATRHTFDDNALQSLRTPDVHLNNTTMEACAALLHHHALLRQSATANNSVIFSMFDLHMAMYSPDRLWEQVKGGSYWCKATWIIPLHRLYPVAHWVCAIVHPNTSDIYLFDSLDERKKWSSNLKELINFVDLLFGEAKGHGYSASSPDLPWKVFSLTQRRLQTSNNSCGLWVLATIASHLDGFHIPDIDEEGIGRFRQKLYAHISNLSPP
ncbi:hypothetical protein DFP72DRAFT_1166659 [Ephemerocybe angulata]|uniref:Ubiquitin-like protease family profile domain-containing protein n=1 Tax=Ephemerocybe angulata TaxID=980116 RepID=A0A8H6MD99_9AGAR|nr:hypothetical protein DFP72DRAFT_1166659 [Tulosesus angulatus]